MAWCAGTAFALEDLRQHSMPALFRRGAGAAALDGEPSVALLRTRREAGVRQQL